jgi:hypothetical protein
VEIKEKDIKKATKSTKFTYNNVHNKTWVVGQFEKKGREARKLFNLTF